ncbi:MAG TPA: sigma-54 dependent transcriptional regulator [Phycisphaerales bacterium]|nr:sigma-54 dependent transcriptional regulator [Phycisphaerales bacterium]
MREREKGKLKLTEAASRTIEAAPASSWPSPAVLVVDDDAIVAESIAQYLAGIGYASQWTHSAEEALDRITRDGDDEHPAITVLICDVSMPGMGGMELVRRAREKSPEIASIVITGYGTIEAAVRAVRMGAIDYLTKPLVDDELRIAVEKAVRQHALLSENSRLRKQLDRRWGLENIIGDDPRMRRLYDTIAAVAPSRVTVLMTGESGTGKSLIARAIHRNSPRKDRPFIEISCGSIPETLLESELFGHVKGAFTGAHADKPGRFLAAHTGTLFLDEINSASPAMPLKLLRVLQERTFEPVGSSKPVEVDVRVILASNQPLEALVVRGEFRQDLYYRINVVTIHLPPLRDRISDIPILAEHFLNEKSKDLNRHVVGFSPEAIEALRAYGFPGNVRELENIIERAVVLTRNNRIGVDDLPPQVMGAQPIVPANVARSTDSGTPYLGLPLAKALEEPEKQIILAALEANAWNRQKTAEALDINRTTLYKKIKQYDLEQYGRTG